MFKIIVKSKVRLKTKVKIIQGAKRDFKNYFDDLNGLREENFDKTNAEVEKYFNDILESNMEFLNKFFPGKIF